MTFFKYYHYFDRIIVRTNKSNNTYNFIYIHDVYIINYALIKIISYDTLYDMCKLNNFNYIRSMIYMCKY